MVLVPMATQGVRVVRNLPIMHHVAPEGHCEVAFDAVRVPAANLLGEPGAGFALAQARLGPGRIHHCMRSIGQCELALELACARALSRRTFGKYLYEHDQVAEWIALSRMEIDQARLYVMSAIKVIVPRLQTQVLDRAMQIFGAMGLTADTPLAYLWTWGRALRFIDGPDEVHIRAVARREIKGARDHVDRAQAYFTRPTDLAAQ